MKKDDKKLKVAILMSGGVDSSVSAWFLKKQGFDVTGFFMKLQNCSKSLEAFSDAKKTAKQIGIPICSVDGQEIFQKKVIDYFINEYENLHTPNPCVKCNRVIKFGWFLEEAKKRGFNLVATGHYAKIRKDKDGIFHLLSGKDKNKDQSYFLHYLKQKHLSRIIFPVGDLEKSKTREIARENKLPVSDKKESQEVCFVPKDDYRAFLKKVSNNNFLKSGDIINTKGKVVGQHKGLTNYTIGQRKGLGEIRIENSESKPMFVLGFGEENNALFVGSEDLLYKKEALIKDVSWTSEEARKRAFYGKNIKVKIRYRHKAVPCLIKKIKNQTKIVFRKPQRAITLGQSAVFYFRNEVLGGGVIK